MIRAGSFGLPCGGSVVVVGTTTVVVVVVVARVVLDAAVPAACAVEQPASTKRTAAANVAVALSRRRRDRTRIGRGDGFEARVTTGEEVSQVRRDEARGRGSVRTATLGRREINAYPAQHPPRRFGSGAHEELAPTFVPAPLARVDHGRGARADELLDPLCSLFAFTSFDDDRQVSAEPWRA